MLWKIHCTKGVTVFNVPMRQGRQAMDDVKGPGHATCNFSLLVGATRFFENPKWMTGP